MQNFDQLQPYEFCDIKCIVKEEAWLKVHERKQKFSQMHKTRSQDLKKAREIKINNLQKKLNFQRISIRSKLTQMQEYESLKSSLGASSSLDRSRNQIQKMNTSLSSIESNSLPQLSRNNAGN